jgi:carboxymethylenebutenolidase
MNELVEEINSLASGSPELRDVNRRGFIKTALGTGFAAAVMPVAAETAVKTDSDGIDAHTVTIKVNGQEVPAYAAKPEGKKNMPVVLVVSEIFGVHEHIADVARRFAKLGYFAIAPDLFVRQGNPLAYDNIATLRKEIISKVPDAQVMADLNAYVAWAAKNGGDIGRLGITGFCWGGRAVWLYSNHNSKVRAGVAWYGRLVGEKNELTPVNPLDAAQTLRVPVLGLYGAKDDGIPLETVEQMKQALVKGKSGSEIIVYPEAGHAFHADYRPSYVESAAKDGWKRCLAWFKKYGVA